MSETMRFSPTPWHVGRGSNDNRVFAADGYEVAHLNCVYRIAEKHFDSHESAGHWATTPGMYVVSSDEQAAADARLMAAAPDLLKACLTLLQMVGGMVGHDGRVTLPDSQTLNALVGQAYEAVQAATGELP